MQSEHDEAALQASVTLTGAKSAVLLYLTVNVVATDDTESDGHTISVELLITPLVVWPSLSEHVTSWSGAICCVARLLDESADKTKNFGRVGVTRTVTSWVCPTDKNGGSRVTPVKKTSADTSNWRKWNARFSIPRHCCKNMSSIALQRLEAVHVEVDGHQPQYCCDVHEDEQTVSAVVAHAVKLLATNCRRRHHLLKYVNERTLYGA